MHITAIYMIALRSVLPLFSFLFHIDKRNSPLGQNRSPHMDLIPFITYTAHFCKRSAYFGKPS